MAGKVRAAADARASADTLIIARTDALAIEGFGAALDRAEAYLEAGADVLFIEAPRSLEQMRQAVSRFAGRAPLLANMVEGGDTPLSSLNALSDLGYRLVLSPGALVRALIPAAEAFLATLKRDGATEAFGERMTDLTGVNARIGLDDMLATGRTYEDDVKATERP